MTDKPTPTKPDDFDVMDLKPASEDRIDRIYRIGFLIVLAVGLVAGCYYKL